MNRLPIEFDYNLYLSGKYDILTRGGQKVTIAGAIQDDNGLVILGKLETALMQWDSRGKYPSNGMDRFDLVLFAKPVTKYINVTLSKSGHITARVTDYKEVYAKSGNRTLAQYEIQVPLDELAQ
jgi:hypothetical protein